MASVSFAACSTSYTASAGITDTSTIIQCYPCSRLVYSMASQSDPCKYKLPYFRPLHWLPHIAMGAYTNVNIQIFPGKPRVGTSPGGTLQRAHDEWRVVSPCYVLISTLLAPAGCLPLAWICIAELAPHNGTH